MSEFTQHNETRISFLLELAQAIRNKSNVNELYHLYSRQIYEIVPSDIIVLVHKIMVNSVDLEETKMLVNKLLNLVFKPINQYPPIELPKESFLWYCEQNNAKAHELLLASRPLIKQLNAEANPLVVRQLIEIYSELQLFTKLYSIKENVIFPLLEKKWSHYRCVQLMWAFHDDIRTNLAEIIKELKPTSNWQLPVINKIAGDISFRITAIIFRDEKILFPHIMETIDKTELDALFFLTDELSFPFVQPNKSNQNFEPGSPEEGLVNLGTGFLKVNQIRQIFNHLPVDITFVDENNQVRYYSTPKHRIFPRTQAIIGRDVKNCHPPASVHIVERIVEAFRKGSKDSASFYIHLGNQYVLIQYFAVRDDNSVYLGVLEVSQEISQIQALSGDKRLLDWED
jgi:DUF438 domain-containing protein